MRNLLCILINLFCVAAVAPTGALAATAVAATPAPSANPAPKTLQRSDQIVKPAAVHNPDAVEFKEPVPIVNSYDLDAAAAGMDNPVGGGTQMDQEIDNIVKKVTKAPAQKPVKPPAHTTVPATALPQNGFGPAKTPAPKQTIQKPRVKPPLQVTPAPAFAPPVPAAQPPHGPAVPPGDSSSNVGPPKVGLLTGPLPDTMKMSPEAYSALRSEIFPTPLWRRQYADKTADKPPVPKLPRGI